MNRTDLDRLARLLDFLNRYRAAADAYFAWIESEYAARAARHAGLRRKARARIAEAAAELPVDREGRIDPRAKGFRAALQRFRRKRDQVLLALVEAGQDCWGTDAKPDKMGVWQGGPTDHLKKEALTAVRQSFAVAVPSSLVTRHSSLDER